jgi:hypothetical protein
MLFGLANASGHAPHDGDQFAIRYDRGLGANVPHFANIRTTSGGGSGIHTAGVGSGSGDSSGQAISPTTAPGPGASYGLRPVGRNTSLFGRPRRAGLLNLYQPTGQGARVVPGRSASDLNLTRQPERRAFPTGGLFGLGFDIGHFFKRAVTIPKSPANIARIALAPFTAGVSLFLPTRVLTPPHAIDSALRLAIDNSIRPAVRYAGAATQTVLFPVLTGSQQRAMFGLSPSESGVFMKAQQIFRGIDAAILTAGAFAGGPGVFVPGSAAGVTPASSAPASLPGSLNLGYAGAPYTGLGSAAYQPAGYATAGQIGTAAAQAAPAAAPISLNLAGSATQAPFVPAGAPLSLPAGYATPATIAGGAPAAAPPIGPAGAKEGLTFVKIALETGKFVGTTAVTTAAQIAVQAALAKGQGGGAAGQAGGQVVTLPTDPGISQGPAQLPYSMGGAGDPGPAPELAGVSSALPQLVIGGLAVTAVVVAIARRKRRKS